MPLPEFTLKHYAGKVTYQVHFFLFYFVHGFTFLSELQQCALQVHKFLDKNFDLVRQDVLDLFIQSRNRVRSSQFYLHLMTKPEFVISKQCISSLKSFRNKILFSFQLEVQLVNILGGILEEILENNHKIFLLEDLSENIVLSLFNFCYIKTANFNLFCQI